MVNLKKYLLTIAVILATAINAFADYSSHGRPWDADENYDSSNGLWFALLLIIGATIFVICIVARNIWDKHHEDIKEGAKIVLFFGGLFVLFLIGKSCSESSSNSSSKATNSYQQSIQPSKSVTQQQSSSKAYQPSYNPPVRQLKYRTEYETLDCEHCHGGGSVVCQHCDGSGSIKTSCMECGGTGSRTVRRPRLKDPLDFLSGYDGYETTTESCSACWGRGWIEKKCSYCENDYPMQSSLFKTYVRCQYCGGEGHKTISRQVPYYE